MAVELWFPMIRFDGSWWAFGKGYKTRDDAEWAIAQWKQANGVTRDVDFDTRLVELADGPDDEDEPVGELPPHKNEGTLDL